jgi:hypothetical protein
MLAWIYARLIGCFHKWELLDTTKIRKEGGDVPHTIRYNMQCTKCGDIKFVDSQYPP